MKATSIQNDAEHQAILNRIDTIFSAQPGTPHGAELKRLVKLVEAYEESRYPIPFRYLRRHRQDRHALGQVDGVSD